MEISFDQINDSTKKVQQKFIEKNTGIKNKPQAYEINKEKILQTFKKIENTFGKNLPKEKRALLKNAVTYIQNKLGILPGLRKKLESELSQIISNTQELDETKITEILNAIQSYEQKQVEDDFSVLWLIETYREPDTSEEEERVFDLASNIVFDLNERYEAKIVDDMKSIAHNPKIMSDHRNLRDAIIEIFAQDNERQHTASCAQLALQQHGKAKERLSNLFIELSLNKNNDVEACYPFNQENAEYFFKIANSLEEQKD